MRQESQVICDDIELMANTMHMDNNTVRQSNGWWQGKLYATIQLIITLTLLPKTAYDVELKYAALASRTS